MRTVMSMQGIKKEMLLSAFRQNYFTGEINSVELEMNEKFQFIKVAKL